MATQTSLFRPSIWPLQTGVIRFAWMWAFAAAVLLPGCSKKDEPSRTKESPVLESPGAGSSVAGRSPAEARAGAASRLCRLLTPEEIRATLGLAKLEELEITDQTDVDLTRCSFGRGILSIRFDTSATADDFASQRKDFEKGSMPTRDVPALGDRAFSTSTRSGKIAINTLAALKGKNQVNIVSEAPVEKQADLIRKIFAKL